MANIDRGNPIGYQKASGTGTDADPYILAADPKTSIADVTPNDAADLANAGYISCLVAGNVKVTATKAGTAIIYLAAGQVFPLQIARVWSTSTTATGITVIY